MVSGKTWLREAQSRLEDSDIDDARLEARFLIKGLLDLTDNDLMIRGDETLSDQDAERLKTALDRRLNREPLSHILGNQPFWTLDLIITPDVLTPRADTETVVEAVLKSIPDGEAKLRILDIGTGSGAILLALLSEQTKARGIGTDKSAAALEVARQNADCNNLMDRVRFVESNWADGVEGVFDIVVSNPPYIARDVIETLDPEVKDNEPHLALDGGVDGLEAYRALMEAVPDLMKPGGLLALEIGYDQGQSVIELAHKAGLVEIECLKDLAGHDRCIRARKI